MSLPAGPRVVVAGSLNYDFLAHVDHLPRAGEAVPAGRVRRDLGGKGFNQAVAARRLGAEVTLLGAVGRDDFGDQFERRLVDLGIRPLLRRTDTPTGMAMPMVDPQGENAIVVALGANLELLPDDLQDSLLSQADLVLLQGELRPETTLRAAQLAPRALLNAAPAEETLRPVFQYAEMVVVNEAEEHAYRNLKARHVIVTLGARGARVDGGQVIPAPRVDAVDTTGAGDAFCAALGVALAEGRALDDAVRWACAAGAAACTREGTSSAMPSREEVEELYRAAAR